MDARECYPLDWFGFYRGIDKADDGLDELIRINYVFEELARDAEKIKDEEKREKFKGVLSYLSERLYEIGEECYKLSAEIDNVREYDFSGLVCEAEEMAEGEQKAV